MIDQAVRTAIRFGLYGLILFSPLPFGSVEPWAVMVVELWAACLGAGALWVIYRDPEALPRGARLLLIPAGLLMLIGLLQLVPLPQEMLRLLAAPTVEIREAVAGVLPEIASDLAPTSLSPSDTFNALLRLAAYVLVGLAAAVTIRSRTHLRQVATVLVVSGTFQALYGSIEYLSGHQQIFGYVKKSYLDSATGTFINRNHFAGYLALVLPFAMGGLLRERTRAGTGSWREYVLRLFKPETLRWVSFGSAAFVILIGVFLSYSRGGLAAAIIAAMVLTLSLARSRRVFALTMVIFLIPAIFLAWHQVKAPGERFIAHTDEIRTLNTRLPVWRATLGIVADYPALGTGYGTFEHAFRLRQPAPAAGRWTHAHNDWLEATLEGGPLAGILLVWILVSAVRSLYAGSRSNAGLSHMGAALLAALLALSFHGLVDFALRIPAIAIVASCLVALAAVCSCERVHPQP